MATYLELHAMFSGEEDLTNKVRVAVVEAARIIAADEDTESPWDQTAGAHDNRVIWVGQAIANTGAEADKMLKLLLAQNKGNSVSTIRGATDSAIQSNVNSMVDVLAGALAAA